LFLRGIGSSLGSYPPAGGRQFESGSRYKEPQFYWVFFVENILGTFLRMNLRDKFDRV